MGCAGVFVGASRAVDLEESDGAEFHFTNLAHRMGFDLFDQRARQHFSMIDDVFADEAGGVGRTSHLDGMSIVAVAPSAYHPSGVAVWLSHLALAVRSAGALFRVALPDSHLHDLGRYVRLYPDLDVVPLRNPTGSQEGRIRTIEAALQHVKPDMVLGVDIADTYLAVNRWRRRRGARVYAVMTCHALSAGGFSDAKVYRDVLDGVVCANRLMQVMTPVVTGIERDRVKYAPCGAGQGNEGTELRSKGVLGGTQPLRLAWVGRLEKQDKRANDIPALVARLWAAGLNFEFRIAGSGTEECILKAQLASFEAQGRVIWMGALAPGRVTPDVLEQVDALLVTSSAECSPLVIWEAMAAQVPVVSSRWLGSRREGALAHEVNCLLFPVGDMERAAENVLSLRDPGIRAKLIMGASGLHRRRYSAAASGRAWTRALADIALCEPRPALRGDPGGVQKAGRLDTVLTPRVAERIRAALGRGYVHAYPGLEWPWQNHSGMAEEEFIKLALKFDVPG